jgi:hypothetical protein
MDWKLLIAVAALLALNAAASLRVVRNPFLATRQKATQLSLVWLLPAVGSIICLVMPSTDRLEAGTSFDKNAFVDSVDASGAGWDAPPDASQCGFDSSGGGADGGD